MIKLVCTSCKKAWYTANTFWTGGCDDCNGKLLEIKNKYTENEIDEIVNSKKAVLAIVE